MIWVLLMSFKDTELQDDLINDIIDSVDLNNSEKLFICGLGNKIRGDDALGPYILENLIEKFKNDGGTEVDIKGQNAVKYITKDDSRVYFLKCGDKPGNFISSIAEKGPDALIIIDATKFNSNPGDLVVEDPKKVDKVAMTTHRIPMHILVNLIEKGCEKQLNSVLIGIEPESNYLGEEMSSSVKQTSDYLISKLSDMILRW